MPEPRRARRASAGRRSEAALSKARSESARRTHAERRLLAIYAETDADTRAAGREWYRSAASAVAVLAEADPTLSHERVAAIVAALSPRERWRRNLVMAADVIARRPAAGLRKNIAKAEAIRDGAEFGTGPGDALGGPAPKVRAFHRNLCGDGDAVTVDVWASRAAFGPDGPDAPSAAQYRWVADAYRRAAARVGERPCDFQAIVWLAVRPNSDNAKDDAHLKTIGASAL